MSYAQIDRNRAIVQRHHEGMRVVDIAREFGITQTRVRQIIEWSHSYERQIVDIPEIRQACQELDHRGNLYNKILNKFKELDLVRNKRWKRMSRTEVMSIKTFGSKATDIIERAQEISDEKKGT